MRKYVAFLALIALSLGACSSAPSKTGSSGKAAGRKDGSSVTIADGTDGAVGVASNKPAQGGNSSGPGAAGGSNPTSSPTPVKYTDMVYSKINKRQGWDCHFAPGQSCKVPFYGSYYLETEPAATLIFAAYENGASLPAATARFPAHKGSGPFQHYFKYTVGPLAKQVTFRVYLETTAKKELASSKSETFPTEKPL